MVMGLLTRRLWQPPPFCSPVLMMLKIVLVNRRLPVGDETRQCCVRLAVCHLRTEDVGFRSGATGLGVLRVRYEAHACLVGGQHPSSEVIGVARAFQLEVGALDRGGDLCSGELNPESGSLFLRGCLFNRSLTLQRIEERVRADHTDVREALR